MLLEKLKTIVGDNGWTSDAETLEPHVTERRGAVRGEPSIMVSPSTTDQVAAIIHACAEDGVGVVPQGGNTGLCGGAIPDQSGRQVLLSLSRMDRIRALDAKDPYTAGHSEAVGELCRLVARECGLDRAEIETVTRAAVLHDIGKVGIPYDVLNKEGRLTPDEFRLLGDLYDGEVAHVDALVGDLVDFLERSGRLDGALLVVTSDHGENIGDHGHFRHVFSLHRSAVRIPLIALLPGGERRKSSV